MKARELANQLLKHPEFDVHFILFEPESLNVSASLRIFEIDFTMVDDIGYSNKVIKLGSVKEI